MLVSPEQIAQVAEILKQVDLGQSALEIDNRRNAQRIKFRATMTVIPLQTSDHSPVRIFTRDLSPAGIGFVSRRYFQQGQRLVLPFKTSPAGCAAKLVLARITFGRYLGKTLYDMGAEFLEAHDDPWGFGRIPTPWLHGAFISETPSAPSADSAPSENPASPPAP